MTDIDEYKKYWKGAKFNSAPLDAENKAMARKLATGKATTAKQKLQRHCLLSCAISILMPALAPILVWIGFPAWLAVFYAVCGVAMCILSAFFFMRLRNINFYIMPTVDAMRTAVGIFRLMTAGSIARLVLAMTLCGTMLMVSLDLRPEIYEGLIAGFVIGVPLGYLRLRKQLRLIKKIRTELESVATKDEL